MTLLERFEQKYIPEPNSGCWLWTAGLNSYGYGSFWWSGTDTEKAHRVSWILHGHDLPEGKMVLHRCDVRCCVNPDHLYLGTAAENNRDLFERGKPNTVYGERHVRAKISAAQAMAIKISPERGCDLAKKYGLARSTVSQIRSGQRWKQL